MADDFDDGKEALRKAIRKEYQDLKSAVDKVTSRTLLITALANASSLFSKASELGIDLKISELLESAEAKVKSYESEIVQDKNRQETEEAAEQKRLEEALAETQKVANEVREKELEEHFKEHEKFQKSFYDQLKEDSDLLDQAIKDPNSLTPEQRVQLTGQYATDNEREAAKKRQQEKSKRWKEHYAIKNEAKESIGYRQGEIKKNEAVINCSNTPEPLREQRRQENAVHKQVVVKHEQKLTSISPGDQRREADRAKILALVNSGNPGLAAGLLKQHYLYHEKDYDKERQKDTNHQGYNELHSMVMALGGHEKLGLPKYEHPVAEQQTPSPQNAHKRAQAIQKTLEQTPVHPNINDELKNEAHKVGLIANKTKPPGTKSKFAQNAKRMGGRG